MEEQDRIELINNIPLHDIKGRTTFEQLMALFLGLADRYHEHDEYITKVEAVDIYATKVYIDNEEFYGATNIGYNPTVNGQTLSIETNILDFDRDIYGKTIKLQFLERIRDEKKFSSIEELKNQLKKDTSYIYKKYICKNIKYMIR